MIFIQQRKYLYINNYYYFRIIRIDNNWHEFNDNKESVCQLKDLKVKKKNYFELNDFIYNPFNQKKI